MKRRGRILAGRVREAARSWGIGMLIAGIPGVVMAATELGVQDTRFTLDGKPTFLLGMSYYGGLGASEDFIRGDLDELQRHGFNWIRVWATWAAFGEDVSAVDAQGRPRKAFLERLRRLIAEGERRGIVVDVTLSRGNGITGPGRLQSIEAHRRAVERLVETLKPHRNWYLDLANERNIRDPRFVSITELEVLRQAVKRIDPGRLITASHAGDLSRQDLQDYLMTVRVDIVCPHRPRHAGSPRQTAARTRDVLAGMKDIGRALPLHYQEPFRRGFQPGRWEPPADAFITDLEEARSGGAAGWCLHNGDQKDRPEGRPRRSFDLRGRRLFDQLDEDERKVIRAILEMHREERRPRRETEAGGPEKGARTQPGRERP